jgi:hypothetical protein
MPSLSWQMAKYFSHILIERGGLGDRQIKGVDMVGLRAHHSLMLVRGFESTITAVSKKEKRAGAEDRCQRASYLESGKCEKSENVIIVGEIVVGIIHTGYAIVQGNLTDLASGESDVAIAIRVLGQRIDDAMVQVPSP